MKKIGLTGGISTGKSTAVDIILKYGIKVIDSDKIVKQILKYNKDVFQFVLNEFGEEFIDNKSILNKKLGEYIFSNKQDRVRYENFIMPIIIHEINKNFLFHENNGEKLCVLDAPTLIEQNLHKNMDYIVLIWTNRKSQLERLKARDKLDEKSALLRINAQMDIEEKKKYVDCIIDNSSTKERLEQQIEHLCLFLNTFK